MNLRHLAFLCGALAGPFLMAQPVLADARQDVMFGAQRCAAIADDRTWLDCFYGSAQPMRARLGLPPAPESQQRLVPSSGPAYPPAAAPSYAAPTYAAPASAAPAYAAPNNAQQVAVAPSGPPPLPRRRATGILGSVFGSSKAVVSKIRMASWSKNNAGHFVVTLADGEIWQQDVGDITVANWRGPASRLVVSVYEGALGSYNMNVSDDSGLYKVHRVN